MLLPADKSGCGLYRMMIPGREVAKSNDHQMYFGGGVHGRVERDSNGNPTVTYLPPLNVDVIVFQRPFDWIVQQCIPLAQAQGVAVVVELDDDVRRVDPMNFAKDKIDPRKSPLSNWKHVVEACRQADWVTVSTPALRSYAPHGRVSVIPNTIPQSVLSVPPRPMHSPPVVSWAGAVTTHPRDLQEVGRGVRNALDATGAKFQCIGSDDGVQVGLQLTDEQHYPATGWVDLPNYPQTVHDIADVGIVPLAKTHFNEAKSWLKGLEMAGLGIPFVASPLPAYRELTAMGVGELAARPYEWTTKLTRLLTDDAYRQERVESARAVIAEKLTIDKVVDQWVDAWCKARAHRDKLSRVAAGV